MRWTRLTALLSALSTGMVLANAAGVPAQAEATPTTSASAHAAAAASDATTVRLLTGDTVTVTRTAGGKQVAQVHPAPGREAIGFRTDEEDGRISVIPLDAAAMVASGTLDRSLFDITGLIQQGYDLRHTDSLPLIVSTGASLEGARTTLGAFAAKNAPVRMLPSLHAEALAVAGDQVGTFWKSMAPSLGKAGTSRAAAPPRIWLDARLHAADDRSAAQIAAPAAWDAGLDGTGVKIAVLDTGIDASHPDLKDRILAAANFTDSPDTDDRFGHGTHVASIIAGSGTASAGQYRGIAPGASLLVGKVLGDSGSGDMSQAIAGMQWAVDQGAQVVNMSLGSGAPSDGSDPVDLALNTLSEESGTLFVVAAGNSGAQGPGSVNAPGSADDALTVGAVDRDDTLAPFSSRGPRIGDGALKPEVTAPGVGIIAARAANGFIGDPVNDAYTAMSGTSMATPHVAGAAALLRQQHPDWTGKQVKDLLISTAHQVPGTASTAQGGGRIDLASAVHASLLATGTVPFGSLESGTAPGQPHHATATLHYTNTGQQTATLQLSATLADTGDHTAPSTAVTLDATTVTVPPGVTANVPVTVDATDLPSGVYTGTVTATSPDGTLAAHTMLDAKVHRPYHTLTVTSINQHGQPAPDAAVDIWSPGGPVPYTGGNGTVHAVVEEGTYMVDSFFNPNGDHAMRDVVRPEVTVDRDLHLTLDARTAQQILIHTPQPAEQRGLLSFQLHRVLDGHERLIGAAYPDVAQQIYISPTAPVAHGSFEFASRWQLVAPLLTVTGPDHLTVTSPHYSAYSPLLPPGAKLAVVDAGTYEDLHLDSRVRGRLALVHDDTGHEVDLMRAAAQAGAAALVLVTPDLNAWGGWTPESPRDPLPVLRFSETDAAPLLARMSRTPTTLTFGGTAQSPYLYDVMQVSRGYIPDHIDYTVSPRNSALVQATYTDNGGTPWAVEQRYAWRPYQDTAWLQGTRYVPTGRARTEYVSADDTLWQQFVHHDGGYDWEQPLDGGMQDQSRTYRPGPQPAVTWFGAVVRPAIPEGAGLASTAGHGAVSLQIPEFVDSTAGHYSRYRIDSGGGLGGFRTSAAADDTSDHVSGTLYRNGQLVGATTDGGTGTFAAAPGTADYRFDLTTQRGGPEWQYATATRTSWWFHADTATAPALLPLLQLDYGVPVDASNTVHGTAVELGLKVRYQDTMSAPKGTAVAAEASWDGGTTWTAVRWTQQTQDRFTLLLSRPAAIHGDAKVSLHITATDLAGNRVEQTVQDAFLQRG